MGIWAVFFPRYPQASHGCIVLPSLLCFIFLHLLPRDQHTSSRSLDEHNECMGHEQSRHAQTRDLLHVGIVHKLSILSAQKTDNCTPARPSSYKYSVSLEFTVALTDLVVNLAPDPSTWLQGCCHTQEPCSFWVILNAMWAQCDFCRRSPL